ncbi:MAG: lysophospholipid acyltransferase family protein [Pseudobdellovibrionaceae bacterium]|jgi:lysophospholipid acyltransferase (LPLAT)-like uncharacterized protein
MKLEFLKKLFYEYIAPRLVWLLYVSLSKSWRLTLIEPAKMQDDLKTHRSFVLAHWHGDELALIHLANHYKIATITSTSKDGELMDKVLKKLGASTSRGSSTRGAIGALKGLVRLAKSGRRCSFAVDGPKGPLHVVKPGVFELSKLLKQDIYTAGVVCDRAWRFSKSWNKTYLPKPFAKVVIVWSGPWSPISENQDPRDPQELKKLAEQLHETHGQALKVIADITA